MGKRYSWNMDGLIVRSGARTVDSNVGRVTAVEGATKQLVLNIKGTELGDTLDTTSEAVTNGAVIPQGALITAAYLIVTTAFTSGGSAVLDIGTYTTAGAAVDDDGIDAAIAVASLTANADFACDGAQVGTVITTSGGVVVAATYDTAAFTAGAAKLVVEYVVTA